MRSSLFALLALAACHVPNPAPVPPDATDAAPAPPEAAPGPEGAPGPQTPCEAACSALRVIGCAEGQQADCVRVLAHIDGTRLIRTPSGKPLTCEAIAGVSTADGARALGLSCAVSP